ncbi:MAG: helix-turn-helix domain-containing protein [Bacilli bacterium]
MSDEIDFGKFLSELRKEKGYTQLQLAQIMHVTDKTISRWENNPGYLDIDTMKQLSDIFDITMDELYAAKRLGREMFIKQQRKKRILMAVIFFLLLIFFFLAFYFVVNYNSVKFYTLCIKNSNFDIRGGYYLETNDINLFQISEIEYLGNEKIDNVYIELYEEDGVSLYSGITKNDIKVELNKNIDVDKLHMKVTYTSDEEKYEEEFKIIYHIKFKNNRIIKDQQETARQDETEVSNDKINALKELGYEPYSNLIYLKTNEKQRQINTINKYFSINANTYTETVIMSKKVLEITYLLYSDYISFQLRDDQNIILEEFYYNFERDQIVCLTKRCGKWDEYIKDSKKEISSIEAIFK